MYTGIVQAVRPLLDVTRYPGHNQFTIDLTAELLDELKIGASVSVEGTCLSVTEINGSQVKFDAMTATLERTNLRFFSAGQGVNIERSAKMNAEVGGHLMAGHIATTAEIVELSIKETGAFIKFRMPPEWAKYVFARGFLGVNGCSLTVADVEENVVTINLIPETLRQTTFARYQNGDLINIEVDHQTMVLVDVVERTLKGTLARENLLR
ncbi:riboflavin synthase [Pseudomonas sp. SWI6]|uniref:Riboflavin synthase n=1 Tax=Pseudomonas taiwanensis TaxID=470150 RepID=A0ABR6V4T1_9PSED|nr:MULTISPECIES: riboflavin synthase [Pseudomonas]AGZ34957.1 riboflavin synthase subunit alpha [Pseudomonas sp. VLB120]AVD83549.1 riboflavin synthase [Pseudomonas sp. SWI6]AVD85696.1 riboflavin synthase [Pseudomonas sp. SWI44]MBC3475240.1 riboflavin synthase [Pseudomonas taiwanensis]MBC3490148.1 riboflavin synthase [Pseudomonas taiwanensis]